MPTRRYRYDRRVPWPALAIITIAILSLIVLVELIHH
jgi:hypothetical protein